jgi:hypothetical protein
VFVEHAIGSLQNPMSDSQLEAKFQDLSDLVLGRQTSELINACWALGQSAKCGCSGRTLSNNWQVGERAHRTAAR